MKKLTLLSCVVAACLAAAVGPDTTFAGLASVIPLDEIPADFHGAQASPTAACEIVPYGGGNFLVFLAGGEAIQDVYFFVNPDSCSTCGDGMARITSLTYGSRTYTGQPCSFDVEVSVLGATAGPCPAPDESTVLCSPSVTNVTTPATFGGVAVNLPPGCCISGDAFIKVRFLGETCGDIVPHPIFYTADGCTPCGEYFTSPTTHPEVTDVCSVFSTNFWYGVDADCCGPVGTQPSTWGKLKNSGH